MMRRVGAVALLVLGPWPLTVAGCGDEVSPAPEGEVPSSGEPSGTGPVPSPTAPGPATPGGEDAGARQEDPGAVAKDAAAGCDAAVATDPKNCGACGRTCDSNLCVAGACAGHMFVTRKQSFGGFGGPAQADAFCAAEAAAAGLSGTYVAWVSTPASPAGARLGPPMTPYVRRGDGRTILATIPGPIDWDGTLYTVRTADGGTTGATGIWTGTLLDGGATSPAGKANCGPAGAPWSVSQSGGIEGVAGLTSYAEWSASVANGCDQYYRFYCFQKRP